MVHIFANGGQKATQTLQIFLIRGPQQFEHTVVHDVLCEKLQLEHFTDEPVV